MTAALHTFYLGLGSNLGDRAATLARAVERLTAEATQWRCADWYATAPVDYTAQPWFLNTVLEITVRLTPTAMLAHGLALEAEFGRVRTTPKGARPLDVDVLLCRTAEGAFLVADDLTLTLPHPRLHLRRFVLTPLCDLIPDERHPRLARTFAALLADCPDDSPVHKVGTNGFNFDDDAPPGA
ncbi:MAG: 2-amino-4-hydroxy-6-hydroxymethyldihydropteridine diphosphokinase [Chloracidobacterium sp.]|nr:2-amino-4-hydroxy-6-hydroxymethyldihydropteridine diphosphokinase [Chloracidobacterium sp.]MDW8217604.1 2-amino-4-hydroxy-6-hydroxymethyldihydropteridine diphosphokinase [Acidobacteriota bacterium]